MVTTMSMMKEKRRLRFRNLGSIFVTYSPGLATSWRRASSQEIDGGLAS
ncbi:hypothetical protein RRG08_064050 [Elysia crispata]|uniref:Uncharacterized protein n=1 Tax=Elysia crispata TaxID=231223 RepID=A0AAE0YF85_9GAST|nr:hypothetical protein RRG08_064050 [Elysia crispata]